MKLLFDTHAFLWFVLGDARMSPVARALVLDPANEKWVSPATYWELAIKISINKYVLNQPYEAFLQRNIQGNGFAILPIEPRHTAALLTLPLHHRDPFDRLLIAQAMVDQLTLLSVDTVFDAYPISRAW